VVAHRFTGVAFPCRTVRSAGVIRRLGAVITTRIAYRLPQIFEKLECRLRARYFFDNFVKRPFLVSSVR